MKLCQVVILIFSLLVVTSIEAASIKRSSKFKFPEHLIGINTTDADEVADFAAGFDYVDMTLDIPDEHVPKSLRMALANATMSDPENNQITQSHYGLLRLQKAISEMYSPRIGQKLDPEDNIVITMGASEALFSSITGHTSAGDEWIVIQPAYSIYVPIIKMARGVPRFTTLKLSKESQDKVTGEDWELDREQMESLFNEKTKGIMINNPLNPLGKVYTREEMQFIANLAIKYDVMVISDEAHEWVTHKPHVRIGSLPGMFERTISIGSATKSFSVSGWRLGWAYGPEDLMNNLKTVHRVSVYYSPTLQQIAIAHGFEEEIRNFGSPSSYFVSHPAKLKRNRDLLAEAILDAGLRLTIADGGCCLHVDWSPLKSHLSEVRDSVDFAKWMVKSIGLLAFPATSYYSPENRYKGENYLRMCYNKKYETVVEATRRLKKLKYIGKQL